jgi:hypothetical protein
METFQVLTAASMNMTVFWEVVLCCLVEIDRRFRGTYCLHHQVGQYLPYYTAQHPRRQQPLIYNIRHYVLTAASMKVAVFWDAVPLVW